jgi:Leucine-rich repeat (LRR) protein
MNTGFADTADSNPSADYKAVCERIERARARKAKSLSLSDYDALDQLPKLDGLLTLNSFTIFGSGLKSLRPVADLMNLRRLYIVRGRVVDLSGIDQLKSLTQLNLFGNPNLSDLSPLQNLTRLRTLVLNSTSVIDLQPINNLRNLIELDLNNTSVVDLTPLRELRNLRALSLSNTPVTDISVLSELPALHTISLNGTQISNIEPIGRRKYIYSLDVSRTRTASLEAIAHLTTSPYYLDIAETQITDLSPIKNFKNLKSLDLSRTNISDLSPISGLTNVDYLYLENSRVHDLSPIANYEHMFRDVSYGGLRFKGSPISDPTVLSFEGLSDRERTRRTINFLQKQRGLPPFEIPDGQNIERDRLAPIENVSSAISFRLSQQTIVLENESNSRPVFPLRNSVRDFERRLEVSRALAEDLISALTTTRTVQARSEYLESLRRYVERLPNTKDDGNILLADAEARTIRNLFASEIDVISAPFAARLKTFLEQHIGLRVFYPEITAFYRDVQNGRINEPLSLDAIDGFVEVIKKNTPAVFDPSVEEAIDGAAEPPLDTPTVRDKPLAEVGQAIPLLIR